MQLIRLTIAILLLCPFWGLSQNYEWDMVLHGLHPMKLQLHKNGTWTTGHLYTSSDTFELEGSWNGQTIELLEFHHGLWTANLKLDINQKQLKGYWKSRLTNQALHIESSPETQNHLSYYDWLNEEGAINSIYLSPTSGLDWFGHAIKPNEEILSQFYVNLHSEKKIVGLNGESIQEEIIKLLSGKKAIPGSKDIQIWLGASFTIENYHALVEIIMPVVSNDVVQEYFDQWKENFLQIIESQSIDLEIQHMEKELDKQRWAWQAHAYVEVYARTDRCWSFVLHSKDLKGNSEVEVFHYDPEEDKQLFLQSEIKNWENLQGKIGQKEEDWDELVFHKEGLITINAFDAEKGIQRTFYPDQEIRKYYRLFSPLKWIK